MPARLAGVAPLSLIAGRRNTNSLGRLTAMAITPDQREHPIRSHPNEVRRSHGCACHRQTYPAWLSVLRNMRLHLANIGMGWRGATQTGDIEALSFCRRGAPTGGRRVLEPPAAGASHGVACSRLARRLDRLAERFILCLSNAERDEAGNEVYDRASMGASERRDLTVRFCSATPSRTRGWVSARLPLSFHTASNAGACIVDSVSRSVLCGPAIFEFRPRK